MTLKLSQLVSFFDTAFWAKFYDKKLNEYKLDERAIPVVMSYTSSPHASLLPKISAYGDYSFAVEQSLGVQTCASPCLLYNFNSLPSFKESDKGQLLQQTTSTIWSDLLTLRSLAQPSLLTRSFIISYADLKQHDYIYWYCSPQLTIPTSIKPSLQPNKQPIELAAYQKEISLDTFINAYTAIPDITQQGFFIFDKQKQAFLPLLSLLTLLLPFFQQQQQSQSQQQLEQLLSNILFVFIDPCATKDELGSVANNFLLLLTILLSAAATGMSESNKIHIDLLAIKNIRELTSSQQGNVGVNVHLSYIYPLELTNINHTNDFPGACAYIRSYFNFLTTGFFAQPVQQENISSWRNTPQTIALVDSLPLQSPDDVTLPTCPGSSGWERQQGKLRPKKMSTLSSMDPLSIYTQAVDMNFKLLRWQHWPEMPASAIRGQRCLLIGSGTLGCYVSRLLLGWGITHITMLDYGKVSPSNPVRQPLFTYQDWLDRKHKSVAACDALRAILPSVHATPVVLSIPGAGTVGPSELPQALQSATELAGLVQSHDVVFLLTDSRASRWLPTVLASAFGKLTIASAIGADTFVALRHGVRQHWPQRDVGGEFDLAVAAPSVVPSSTEIPVSTQAADVFESFKVSSPPTDAIVEDNSSISNSILISKAGQANCGCYFCPDQAAPITAIPSSVDQQCTVTRAEVAALASAYAVNLFIDAVTHDCQFISKQGDNMQSSDAATADQSQSNNDGDDDNDDNHHHSHHDHSQDQCTCQQNSQVRGTVITHFNSSVDCTSLTCPPSHTCIACGDNIIKAFQNDPVGFLTATLTDAQVVTDLSGFQEYTNIENWDDDDWEVGSNSDSI